MALLLLTAAVVRVALSAVFRPCPRDRFGEPLTCAVVGALSMMLTYAIARPERQVGRSPNRCAPVNRVMDRFGGLEDLGAW